MALADGSQKPRRIQAQKTDDLWNWLAPKLKSTIRGLPRDRNSLYQLRDRCKRIISTLTFALFDAAAIADSLNAAIHGGDLYSPTATYSLGSISQACIEEVISLSEYLPNEPAENLRWLKELIDLKASATDAERIRFQRFAMRMHLAGCLPLGEYREAISGLPTAGREWDEAADKVAEHTEAFVAGKKRDKKLDPDLTKLNFKAMLKNARRQTPQRKINGAKFQVAFWDKALQLHNIGKLEANLRTMFEITNEVCAVIDMAIDSLLNNAVNEIESASRQVRTSDSENSHWVPELYEFARHMLKGKQFRVLELVLEARGKCPIASIASDSLVDWPVPFDDAWNSTRKQINKKLIRAKQPFRLRRTDNSATLEEIPVKNRSKMTAP